ncbi:hypothetical protein [Streptoalloteichus hindustanus]|uniref:Uncharacterized protein n=1 Tax=Streptoalloteichus hindustanus TaxID=2017 RepID=A0A1M5FH92_STRHI|nr:hypothetical protein [Streptoalloteichus hindustanus]SHF90522.1 hypothetical protein SAMN05444320_105427 [Streptoalloteichus hindustanus]
MNDKTEDHNARYGGADIGGNARDVITDPRSPVHTGSGSLVNIDIQKAIVGALGANEGFRPRLRQAVAEDEITWLAKRFVEPRNFAVAQHLLRDRRTVLLGGRQGSGRRSAALMLLAGLSHEGAVRILPPEPDETGILLNPNEVDSRERLLLDLTHAPADTSEALHAELSGFRAVLFEKEAHLAVALPTPHDSVVRAEFRSLSTDISRPDGAEVLRTHLTAEKVPISVQQLNHQELRPHLATSSMDELARLAHRMRMSYTANERDPFEVWLRKALSALTDRGEEVANKVRGKSGQERALMFVTAFLHDGPADVVPEAENRLLRAIDFPDDGTHALDRPDLVERLSGIGAHVDQEQRVRFSDFEWDTAIRSHFWLAYSPMRAPFLSWASGLIETANLRAPDTDRIAYRLAEQCLRWRQPGAAVSLAQRWAEKREPRLTSAATVVLVQGLTDEVHGGFFRRSLYDWARDAFLNPNLARIVIALCTDVLAPTLPDRALVRLHHLTRHRDREVSTEASNALTSLAEDHRFFRRLLDRLARWVDPGDPRDKPLSAVDIELLRRTAQASRLLDSSRRSQPLIADQDVRGQLELLWNAVLRAPERKAWFPLLGNWLETSLNNSTDVPLDLVVRATGSDTRLLGTLFHATSQWVAGARDPAERAGREQIQRQVLDKINDVMGLRADFADPSDKETVR